MPPGIPLSLERREFLMRAAAAGTALAVIAGTVIYLLALPGAPEPGSAPDTPAYDVSPEAALAERDRAAAYKAVRDHMHHRAWGSDIKAVYCRDSSHVPFGGGIEFQGRIDLEPHAGELIPMDYTATVRGDRIAGWTVESVSLIPPGGYSEGESGASGEPGSALTGEAGPSALMPEASTQ